MTGIELIAQERARQISKEGWTTKHDEQHVKHELVQAAVYYCAYDEIADLCCDLEQCRTLVEQNLFPASWADAWKKRQGFPVPTDRDLVKAGALIAAELDRRAAERAKNGTGQVVILCPSCRSGAVASLHSRRREGVIEKRSCLNCGHVWLPGSAYGPAVEEPEEEV